MRGPTTRARGGWIARARRSRARAVLHACAVLQSRFQLFVRDCRAVRVQPSEIGSTSRDEDDYRWDSALALAAAGTWCDDGVGDGASARRSYGHSPEECAVRPN